MNDAPAIPIDFRLYELRRSLRKNPPPRRQAGVTLLALGVVLLSGCASPAPVDSSRPRSPADAAEPGRKASPTPTPPASRRAPEDLSFETGADLDPTKTRVQWFTFGDGFTELSPDDGNGSWAITDTASQCAITFYQGAIYDLDYSQDDRTVSDDMLWLGVEVAAEGSTRDDVTENAFDDDVPLFVDPGTLPFRTIWVSGTDGSSWLMSARGFGSLGGGVIITIDCPAGQDANEVFTRLRDHKELVVDVGPGRS